MREILFRGKLSSTGEWAYGCLKIVPDKRTAIITPDDTIIGKYGQVEPDTVGQYTGLKDENGVKIFDGDIVLCTSNFEEVTGEVVFNERTAGFEIWRNFVCGAYGEMATKKDNLAHYEKYRIVGNVHDNQ